jgi:hypothetical protein
MSWLSKGLKSIESAVAGIIPHQSAQEARMKADAISSYYAQKDAALAEQSRLGEAKTAEMRRIQEKQIRAKRNKFRAAGFMQPMADSGFQDKLG